MDTCITVTNPTDKINTELKIWYNKVMEFASNEERLIGDGVNNYLLSELQGMNEEQVRDLCIYGKKQGVLQHAQGLTIAQIAFKECDNEAGKFWSRKPVASLMIGVVNTTDEEYNAEWNPLPLDN